MKTENSIENNLLYLKVLSVVAQSYLLLLTSAERLALVADCHEKQPTKRDQAFERKMPFNRNVANRPLHALLGFVYEQADALTEIADCVKHHRTKE